jgi:hypothetical protein
MVGKSESLPMMMPTRGERVLSIGIRLNKTGSDWDLTGIRIGALAEPVSS